MYNILNRNFRIVLPVDLVSTVQCNQSETFYSSIVIIYYFLLTRCSLLIISYSLQLVVTMGKIVAKLRTKGICFKKSDKMNNKDQEQPSRGVLRKRCSAVNLLHIFKTPFRRNTSGWLLLKDDTNK